MDTALNDHSADLADVVDRLGRLLRSLRHTEGLRPAQWEVLRYLTRANLFSRCPGCLASYLGSTRGTVSQTLITLDKKGLLQRKPSEHDGRGTLLELTQKGRTLARRDPLRALESAAGHAAQQNRLADALNEMLSHVQKQNDRKAFGVCRSCRHFRPEDGAEPGEHYCGKKNASLSDEEAGKICIEHAAA